MAFGKSTMGKGCAPVAMSFQRGEEGWRTSMAAVKHRTIRILSKPDIVYRGVVGSSLRDLALRVVEDLTYCHRLRPADGGKGCLLGY